MGVGDFISAGGMLGTVEEIAGAPFGRSRP